MGFETESAVDDDAIEVDVVGGGHGDDLVNLDELVVFGEVEEGVGDSSGESLGISLGDGLLVVDSQDDEVVAEFLADGLEVGHLFKAEVASVGPEVDYDGFLPRNWSRLTTSPSESVSMKLGVVSPTSVLTS